jgi:tagatose-6-phosphate ketose/aldose isomerase
MSNALGSLLSLNSAELELRGLQFTPAEIAGQVDLWPTTLERFIDFLPGLRPFLQDFMAQNRRCMVLTGAGTSEYVGLCVEGLLRRLWGLPVNTISSTALVARPQDFFVPAHATLLVSLARSGSSPESLGAVRIAEGLPDPVYHLLLTANPSGELAQAAGSLKRARLLALDVRTNDRSLAMTGAFTNLVLAGQMLAHAFSFEEYSRVFPRIVEGGRVLLERAPDPLAALCRSGFDRAVFLGDGPHFGTAVESRLKLQELTAGRVMCAYDTFPGLRHGPEALIHERTLIGAFLSEDPFARRYELDLLEELRRKQIGQAVLAVADRLGEAAAFADVGLEYDPDGKLQVPAEYAPPIQVMAGQLAGLFKGLELGLPPDNPSAAGIIHRVVEGVKVYDPRAFHGRGRFEILAQR